jgi:hypothetical protein
LIFIRFFLDFYFFDVYFHACVFSVTFFWCCLYCFLFVVFIFRLWWNYELWLGFLPWNFCLAEIYPCVILDYFKGSCHKKTFTRVLYRGLSRKDVQHLL